MAKQARSKGRTTDELKGELADLRRENGELRQSLANLRQMTAELKETEETLRLSEEKFRLLFENAYDEVIHLDKYGTVIDVNESVENLFGFKREEVIGRNIADFPVFNPGTRQEMLDLFKSTLEEDHRSFIEVELRHKDGRPIVVEPNGSLIKREGKVEGILVFLKDVSERHRWKEKLEGLYNQEKQLRQQIESEMQRRVDFSRMLAHELKTPLTSILNSTDSLIGELQDERLMNLAQNISRGTASLSNRVEELLDLARDEVGILKLETESVDILGMLKESIETILPVAERQGQSITSDLPPSLPPVRADSNRIQQVISNLLDNALKFTPPKGEIKLSAKSDESNVIVEVQDTGRGMSKQEQDRVFEPYHRLADDQGRMSGLGLGLALCKRLVELHGGQIWVKSRPGKGALFSFRLPADSVTHFEEAPPRTDRLWKVLIIEDDPQIVDSVAMAFQKDWPEAELISARMGREGIEMVESESVDIVILDLSLPDIDGFDVLEQLRLFSSVPVIIVTVRDEESDITRGLKLGADDYVTKPFKKKELLARLQVQLRKRDASGDDAPVICGSLKLEPATFQLRHGEKEISLTTIEGHILKCLMNNRGRVVTHSRLAEEVWGEDYPGAVVSLRTHIRTLRGKLEVDPAHPQLILTKAGIGYFLAKTG
ncbi:MAG: ATP-binding protein [Dehalococcoidia bacterium]